MTHKTQTLREALADFRIHQTRHIPAPNWRAALPPGSRWQPGFPGRPDCAACRGIGYLTLDCGIHHPQFGKLVTCDCVPEPLGAQIRERIDRLYESGRRR